MRSNIHTRYPRFIIPSLLFLLVVASSAQEESPPCADRCFEINCDQVGIRYGKYCGVGHGGCPGEKPCDSVDACCKGHDECVEEAGILSANTCHTKFIKCINKNQGKGDGFSTKCPYDVVVPTMRQGIEMAMMFTSMFSGAAASPPAARKQAEL